MILKAICGFVMIFMCDRSYPPLTFYRLLLLQVTYAIGLAFTLGASAAFYFLPIGSKLVYGGAVLSGIGGSTILVTSLAMTADLIHENAVSRKLLVVEY